VPVVPETPARRAAGVVLPLLAYLGISVALFSHVWSAGASRTFLDGYGDPGQEIWFLGWVAHALSHGLDPFFSPAMFAPRGVNLMANTAFPLLGALLSPITLAFGPVVAFDVAVTLAPALSAMSAYFVLRRVAPWPAAAGLGAAFFGFSPAVLAELRQGHLQVTFLALVPVLVALTARALGGEDARPVRTGVLLGLAVAAQELIGPEVLAITAVTLAVLTAGAALSHPAEARRRLGGAAKAIVTAAAVSGALVAYPIWYGLDGPRHLTTAIPVSPLGAPLVSLVLPSPSSSIFSSLAGMAYVGIPLLLVAGIGLAVLRRERGIRSGAGLAAVALVFALGTHLRLTSSDVTGFPLPSDLLAHLPLLRQIAPVRFALLAPFGLGAVLAVTVDRARLRWRGTARLLVAPVALTVLVLAGLLLVGINGELPYPARPVDEPAVYETLAGGRVLSYPLVSQFVSDQLVWEALGGFRYEIVEGYAYGPSRRPGDLLVGRSPVETAFADAELGLPVTESRAAVRWELRALGVSTVVVMPGRGAGEIAGFLSGATGTRPRKYRGARVWRLS
jgi:hypothetical protein